MANKKEEIKKDNTIAKKTSTNSKAADKDAKLDKEAQKVAKIKEKEKADKKLSSKEKEKLRLLKTKTIYKNDKEYALRLKNVKRTFGMNKKILRGVTFDIKKGERLALIGKNGSGKSTLINIISQQLRMSEGEIRYGYATNRVESLELMGIQFQTLNYPEGFIVKDVIHFFNVSVEKSIRMSKNELSDMVSMFGIDKYLNQSIDRLSGGQQQRINILLALIKKPKLLILDEISTGLDVESAEIIKEYIEQYLSKYPETALLLVSHSDEEIKELTDRTVVLEAGKIVEDFSSKELTSKRFLEITSREPKLTKKELEAQNAESEKYLKQLRRSYVIPNTGKLGESIANIKHNIDLKFGEIDNTQMDEGNSLEFRGISKTYGKTVGAVRNVSLDIVEGSRIAITGPNGSGKSTIVEILAQVKTKDKESARYKNLRNLAKADLKSLIAKLDENIKVEIRKDINKYRLERELAYNEAKELAADKNAIAKEKLEKSKSKKTLNDFKAEIDAQIEKMIADADAKVEKAKAAIAKKEEKLNAQFEIDVKKANEDFKKQMKDIDAQEKEYKNDNRYRYSDPFMLNGKELKGKGFTSDKPQIAYSFAKTSRQVRDNTGVQFQYASFPVEMTVLDVILFFARTNKYFLDKEEMANAIKVFKLEKLLKSRAYRLSGGERQRLNVLLAIMKSPKLLILDEISTGLDVDSIVKIDAFIKEYLDRTGATLILISHNYHEVHSLTDRIVVMKYGKLTEIIDTKGWTLKQSKDKMRDIYKGGGN